jgi:sterol desaturase/sphingolipid hydroxylase (fatty acid hydroxylase superfamily)
VRRVEVLRASPALFESRWLDRLTRVSPFVPPLLFVPVIVVCGWVGFTGLVFWVWLVCVVGGYGLWTLCEYWIHRSVFHLEPRSRFGQRLHFVIHGVHHDHPSDPLRLVMPPVVSVPVGVLFGLVFVAVGGVRVGLAVGAGFYGGYLFYDMVHYALHHSRPKGRVGRRLHQLHMRHHFDDDTRGFGVSAPWWDLVFQTAPAASKRPPKPTH